MTFRGCSLFFFPKRNQTGAFTDVQKIIAQNTNKKRLHIESNTCKLQ